MFLSELKSFVAQHRNKGRGEAFGFDDITTEVYLKWAFSHDYLLVDSNESGVTGVAIVYPIKYSYNDPESMFCFKEIISKDKEHLYELCIMDVVSLNRKSLKNLVSKFKTRYPYWHNVKKWALRFGNPKEINNKYIELL
jgi:hypothetical protein